MSENQNDVKKLVANLFTYVKEIKSRLEKPVLSEKSYEWLLNLEEIPDHPYIFKKATEDYFLKIKRPKVKDCPSPPVEISDWVKSSWKFIDKDLDYLKSKNVENDDGTVTTIFIKDFPDVLSMISEWNIIREEWREAELPSEEVRKVFSYLHEVKSRIEKDSEGSQLYLTEGVLVQKNDFVDVRHPLIYKEIGIELVADLSEPEIFVTKATSESSIYVTILRSLEVNGATLAKLKDEFRELDIDPDSDKIDLFLKNLVHRLWQNGQFSEEKCSPSDNPTVFQELKLILGKRESSFAEQIDNYIAKIESLEELPVAYQNMVGYFKEKNEGPPDIPRELSGGVIERQVNRDYYLIKAYNSEQKKIINLLEDSGCVSVQGPPGTGKSHTIANLVGHLLAKGESVLVSSYRSKALEVIRDQVVENIRPLCVSILDDQKKNKEELQGAVNYLEELISRNNVANVTSEVDGLKVKRKELLSQIKDLEEKFLKCILSEYKPIPFRGEGVLPKDAAKFISENVMYSTIDGPFYSDVLPIDDKDFGVYRSPVCKPLKPLIDKKPALAS